MAKAPDDRWPTAADLGRSLQSVERMRAGRSRRCPSRRCPTLAKDAPLDPSAATGDVTTPGLRQSIRPERISHPLNAGPPPPAGDVASAGDGQGDLPVTPLRHRTRKLAFGPGAARRRRRPKRRPKHRTAGGGGWPTVGAGLVVVGIVVGLVTSSGSSGRRVNPTTPRLQTPSASLAASLAPRQVEIINEQPTTVTIRWVGSEQWPLPVRGEGVQRRFRNRRQPHPDGGRRPRSHQGLLLRGGGGVRGGRAGGQRSSGVRAGRNDLSPSASAEAVGTTT